MSQRTSDEAGAKAGAIAGDGDISPMEAQDTGPAKTGPAEKPLRQDEPGAPSGDRDVPDAPMKPGGESATRDDIG